MSVKSKKILTDNDLYYLLWLIKGGNTSQWPEENKTELAKRVRQIYKSPANRKSEEPSHE